MCFVAFHCLPGCMSKHPDLKRALIDLAILCSKRGLTMKARFLISFVLVLSFFGLCISPTTFAAQTTVGKVTEYLIQTIQTKPYTIAWGRDGNLWFTGYDANMVGRITPGGTVTEFPLPNDDSEPYGITSGPDG